MIWAKIVIFGLSKGRKPLYRAENFYLFIYCFPSTKRHPENLYWHFITTYLTVNFKYAYVSNSDDLKISELMRTV